MRYTNILFDVDGTLTDSGEGIMNSGKYAFEKLGLKVPEVQDLRKMVGPPLGTSFAFLGVPEEKVEEAIALFRDNYHNKGGKFQCSVYPGIENMLKALQAQGCKLYVATSKPELLAKEMLEYFRIAHYFEFIAGAALDHSRERKADVLSYLLRKIGRDNNTVMVGDTSYDVIGANEQGVPCIGVAWGYGVVEDLQADGAVTIVTSPEELTTYICR